jgi:hypothetical protein
LSVVAFSHTLAGGVLQLCGTPTHTPLLQESADVHALLSLQLAPFAYAYVHDPF